MDDLLAHLPTILSGFVCTVTGYAILAIGRLVNRRMDVLEERLEHVVGKDYIDQQDSTQDARLDRIESKVDALVTIIPKRARHVK